MFELQGFPEEGIEFSEQASALIAEHPWIEEEVFEAMIGLVIDLMKINGGLTVEGQSAESISYLKDFSNGGKFLCVVTSNAKILVVRRPAGGWVLYLSIFGGKCLH